MIEYYFLYTGKKNIFIKIRAWKYKKSLDETRVVLTFI